jgi:hypothetical protein
MNNKLKPALIGGITLGILSVIPFVNFANACCCLWAILGGLLATNLYVKSSPTPVNAGDGAIVGAMAGLVGAIIAFVLGVPIDYAMGPVMRGFMVDLIANADPQQAEMVRRSMEGSGQAIGTIILQGLIGSALLFVFAIIGGLLGVPLFEKRKGGPPPPPPINVGGSVGGPGGYAA